MKIYVVKWDKVCCCVKLYREETMKLFETKTDAEDFKLELLKAKNLLRHDYDLNIRITEEEVL